MDKKVEIVLDSACNNNCLFCSAASIHGFKEFKRVERELAKTAKYGVGEICFTGGEPTLRKDLAKFVRKAAGCGVKNVSIATNGRMFADKEFAESIVRSGLNSAAVSVHSAKPEVHDFLVSVKGAFGETMNGIENLRSLGVAIKTNSVITTLNCRELPKMFDFFTKKCGAQFLCMVFPFIEGNLKKNAYLVPSFDEVREPIQQTMKKAKEKGITMWPMNVPLCVLGKNFGNPTCVKLKTKMYWYNGSIDLDENARERGLKLRQCNNCKFKENCPGIGKDYLRLKGSRGIKAIR